MFNHAVPVCYYSFASDFLLPVAHASGRIAGAGPTRKNPSTSTKTRQADKRGHTNTTPTHSEPGFKNSSLS
ncbi:hypothetical protein EXU85_02855 [Spirosoma sp. KCTC 42546]|uniref:hypothetical protein n=1 Tax=Spirosoma sp. KCTC 42546 TaxID=2520506 RepID=UPI00115A4FB0|nr:hypothetical protein [Spirosoma sp. KCTC 42546]QDK77589.1 hypothetical protein EXU85_02855 [Spirosoma sp. KCTC 42546]